MFSNDKKSNTINTETRKAQIEMQNREIAETLRHIKNKILVISGKGGVGKSSVAAYLSVALTVAQTIPDARALIVTTPQEVSLADVRKSINFCHQVKMEILGLVENKSGLKCPKCGAAMTRG